MSDVYSNRPSPGINASYDYIPGGAGSSGDSGRVLPRQISTGSTRGTQKVGYGRTNIDGSTNTITVGDAILISGQDVAITVRNTDNSLVGFGLIGDSNEFGFFARAASGRLVFKIVNGLLYMYDQTGVNTLQLGLLSNGTTNLAIARDGQDVATALES